MQPFLQWGLLFGSERDGLGGSEVDRLIAEGEFSGLQRQHGLPAALGHARRGRLRHGGDQGLAAGSAELHPGLQREAIGQLAGRNQLSRDAILLAVKHQAPAFAHGDLHIHRFGSAPQPLHREAVFIPFEDLIFPAHIRAFHDLHQITRQQPVVDGVHLHDAVARFLVARHQAVKHQARVLLFQFFPFAHVVVLERRIDAEGSVVDRSHRVEAVVGAGVEQPHHIPLAQSRQLRLLAIGHRHLHPVGIPVTAGAADAPNRAPRCRSRIPHGADLIHHTQRQQNLPLFAA